jgi:hypothetical protein
VSAANAALTRPNAPAQSRPERRGVRGVKTRRCRPDNDTHTDNGSAPSLPEPRSRAAQNAARRVPELRREPHEVAAPCEHRAVAGGATRRTRLASSAAAHGGRDAARVSSPLRSHFSAPFSAPRAVIQTSVTKGGDERQRSSRTRDRHLFRVAKQAGLIEGSAVFQSRIPSLSNATNSEKKRTC